MMNHNETHMKLLRGVFRYLKSTAENSLSLGGLEHEEPRLIAYSDADSAGNISDRKSRTGSLVLFGK